MYLAPKLDRFSACLLIPGRVSDERGFIIGDGRIEGLRGDITPAISIEAIRNAAARYEQVGLVDRDELTGTIAALVAMTEDRDRLQAENDQLRESQEHIAGLRRAGFQVSKIKGRPAAKQEASA